MPTAYIYRGTFQVRSSETLRYIEVAADGTLGPEVTSTYVQLAGIGAISMPAVSLTPSVSAPTLSGVQIGAIAGAPVSLQPVVSPAAVSGVTAGSISAAPVSLQPTVAVPSLAGVQVGIISAAAVSLQPTVTVGALTGVTAQTGSIDAAAVSLRPTVAVGSLTGVIVASGPSDNFNRADGGLGSNWSTVTGRVAPVIASQKVGKTASTDVHAAFWNTDTFANNQWAIARVYPEIYYGTETGAADSLAGGISVRTAAGTMGYHASVNNYHDGDTATDGFVVSLWLNGARVGYHYSSFTPDEYPYIKVTAVGTTVTVYGGQTANGTWDQLSQVSGAAIASGSAGVVLGGFSYANIDDWSGGDI